MSLGVVKIKNTKSGHIIYTSKYWKERDINGKTYIDAVKNDPSVDKNQTHFYILKEYTQQID